EASIVPDTVDGSAKALCQIGDEVLELSTVPAVEDVNEFKTPGGSLSKLAGELGKAHCLALFFQRDKKTRYEVSGCVLHVHPIHGTLACLDARSILSGNGRTLIQSRYFVTTRRYPAGVSPDSPN